MKTRYKARKASECPRDSVVIPFIDEEGAAEVAQLMNDGSEYHLSHEWCRGPASKYTFDDEVTWVVFDTHDEVLP